VSAGAATEADPPPESAGPAPGAGPAVAPVPPTGLDEVKANRSLRNGLISLAILVALVIGLLLAIPGLHGVAREVTHMPTGLVAAALACEFLSCVSYIVAFLQVFERAPIRFGARVALSELAFGAAVSLGGAGSVAVGAWLLVDRGAPAGRIAERSAVLFLLTSAINVITLALAGFGLWLGLLPGPSDPLLSLVPGIAGLGAFVGFLLLPWFADRLVSEDHRGRPAMLIRGTSEAVRDTAEILFRADWRILGAVGFLWFDIAVLWLCFTAIGPAPPLATIVLAYQIGYLSNLIPIPGGIGVLDGSFVGMFVIYGVSATAATAATLVYHAISLWVPAMWGTAAYVALRRTRGEPITLRPVREPRRRERARTRA
jgi:uncharacterized membrane protein YbhN (UPF0104 family)